MKPTRFYACLWIALLLLPASAFGQSDANTLPPPISTSEEDIDGRTGPKRPAGASNVSAEAVAMSEPQRQALTDVTDYTTRLHDAALDSLLELAVAQSPVDTGRLRAMEQPAYAKLLTRPWLYRGQAVRLEVIVLTVRKLMPGEGIYPGASWPAERPVWRIDGFVAGKGAGDRPLTVFSVVDPVEQFGPADVTKPDGTMVYDRLVQTPVVGLFYKVYNAETRDGDLGSFPVLVAWQFPDSGGRQAGGTRSLLGLDLSPVMVKAIEIGIPALLLVLLIGFYLLRRHVAGVRRSDRPAYRALREELEESAGEALAESDGVMDREEPVDPELLSAVAEYRKEHPVDDGESIEDGSR